MEMISIVIPVYNTENYIDRCLSSIQAQTYKKFKVILIDDGSTDGSLAICEGYAQNDERFMVIHQENQGPSAARNTGLKYVTGKYLCFMDSDDAFSTNEALKILFDKMESTDADVCIYAWNRYECNRIQEYVFTKKEMKTQSEELIKIIMKGNYMGGGGNPWNKIWKIETLKQNGKIHQFDATIQVYEDMLWVIEGLLKIQNIVYVEIPIYQYYIREGSLSRMHDAVERRRRFALGAQKVYTYICDHFSAAERETRFWYRDKYSKYLFEKIKAGQHFTYEEIEILKGFSLNPIEFERIKCWIQFFIVKIVSIYNK